MCVCVFCESAIRGENNAWTETKKTALRVYVYWKRERARARSGFKANRMIFVIHECAPAAAAALCVLLLFSTFYRRAATQAGPRVRRFHIRLFLISLSKYNAWRCDRAQSWERCEITFSQKTPDVAHRAQALTVALSFVACLFLRKNVLCIMSCHIILKIQISEMSSNMSSLRGSQHSNRLIRARIFDNLQNLP